MGGARNSAAQTGTGAFERARASAKLSDSKTLAAAEAVASDPLESLSGEGGAAPETRRGGRTDVHPPGRVWTDVAQADRITVTDVAEYSRAYFDLVRQLPEVAPYLSVGEEILIAGRRVSVRIARSGIEIWQPGQLAALVRDFRGT
jgi:hypothetical protein